MKVLLDKPPSISDNPPLQALANEMKMKYDKYWSESNTLISIGAVLDPRYKFPLHCTLGSLICCIVIQFSL